MVVDRCNSNKRRPETETKRRMFIIGINLNGWIRKINFVWIRVATTKYIFKWKTSLHDRKSKTKVQQKVAANKDPPRAVFFIVTIHLNIYIKNLECNRIKLFHVVSAHCDCHHAASIFRTPPARLLRVESYKNVSIWLVACRSSRWCAGIGVCFVAA